MDAYKFSWANLFGHASTVKQLRTTLAEETFPHAVIFSGDEGIGKRLAAQICAAALLCEQPVDGSPCGTCDGCQLMAAGTHPDFNVVEPEETKATRNIKIGQIRELQSQVALSPLNSSRRVAIIDGAELMLTAAANSSRNFVAHSGASPSVAVSTHRSMRSSDLRASSSALNAKLSPWR